MFALTLVALAILGLIKGHFAPVWQAIPQAVPAREALAYLCSLVYLACGLGLLWPRTAARAAPVLLAWLLLWMLLFKVPYILLAPAEEVSYQSWGESAVVVAGAWVLYAGPAAQSERRRLASATAQWGLRIARLLYGLALIAFGLSHFVYLGATAPLVPHWLPAHRFWAYATGASYLGAGAALITNRCAAPAAALSALQIALITLLVWPPLLAGGADSFRWSEFVVSWQMSTAAWVVADCYRRRAQ